MLPRRLLPPYCFGFILWLQTRGQVSLTFFRLTSDRAVEAESEQYHPFSTYLMTSDPIFYGGREVQKIVQFFRGMFDFVRRMFNFSGECLILSGECLILSGECLILSGECLILSGECLILSGGMFDFVWRMFDFVGRMFEKCHSYHGYHFRFCLP